ncbi:MATE family efflux transporter [Rhizobium esperanzae]|uniref:MATE family efflux transporter n=1 Tax=Rhizobium esperanzae TaxID=1967781 RepID=A0A246DKX8_9HYPH|nr:MATE family efflux transporter [Rhizobium esperanzae]OWO89831.1 MATE family efflux transporter [Rhizobium esperanzae]
MEQKVRTHGPRPFQVNNRRVLAIAIPITLAYLTTPLLGLVDTAVVGQFGDTALLGGIAAGAVVFDVVFSTFSFLRSATVGLVAQAFGKSDLLEERKVFWRAFAIAATSGFTLALVAPIIAAIGEWLMNADKAVTDAMNLYIRIRLISAPAALINYAILGYAVGRGEAGLGLFLQIIINALNFALSIFLGLHLGWGVAGVAWAAVCGEVTAMFAGMAVLLWRFRAIPKISPHHTFNINAMRSMFHLNGNIMIRTFVLNGAYLLFMRQSAQLSTLTVAANGVLMHFLFFAEYALGGLATAAQQLVGRAIGACDRPAFSRAITLTISWGFAVAALASALVFSFGEQLVSAATKIAEVRSVALFYLPWAALTAPSGVLAFLMTGVFIGATWSREMRNMMLLSFAVFIPFLFAFGELFGNHGLWASYHIFMLVRGMSLLAVMRRRVRTAFPE